MILIISLIRECVVSERHIAYRDVKKAVRKIRFFKALNLNVRSLIELLCDPSGQPVELHAVQLAVFHAFRQHSEEIADAAGRFQYVPGAEAHVFDRLIDCANNGRGGIVRVQHGCPCGIVFFVRQRSFQLGIFSLPLLVLCIERLRKTAPADIL